MVRSDRMIVRKFASRDHGAARIRTARMTGMPVRHDRDVVFASRPSGDLLLDLVLPDSSQPVPVVIWLHGGGWFTGDRTLAPDLAARAEATGCAFASIEYRLSGDALFPAQILDLRAAIRFLRENAQRWGLDPSRIGLWGSSAGAHLAALAGATGHVEAWDGEDPAESATSVAVQAVSAAYPPVDLVRCVDDALEARPGSNPASFPESRLLGGVPRERSDLATSANPAAHVAQAPSLPPMQLAHGTADVAVGHVHSEILHSALLATGADAELFLLDGYKHGFLNPGGRMEAGLKDVMDDGRLEAETWATARRMDAAGNTNKTRFGFETIDAFFRAHLIESTRGAVA